VTTPLYPTFRKRVDDAVEHLIVQQVTPWSFLTAGPPFHIKTFDEREISYAGVGFDGSPRMIFWTRYIEPFLEALAVSEIGIAVSMAKGKGVDAKLLLPEVQGLLSSGFRKVYARMAEVDRRLRGKGFPNTVELRSVESEVRRMDEFLDERIRSELMMWKPKSRREGWYERNKFFVWAVGILITIVFGLLARR
jgi:hypothetical protein